MVFWRIKSKILEIFNVIIWFNYLYHVPINKISIFANSKEIIFCKYLKKTVNKRTQNYHQYISNSQ